MNKAYCFYTLGIWDLRAAGGGDRGFFFFFFFLLFRLQASTWERLLVAWKLRVDLFSDS